MHNMRIKLKSLGFVASVYTHWIISLTLAVWYFYAWENECCIFSIEFANMIFIQTWICCFNQMANNLLLGLCNKFPWYLVTLLWNVLLLLYKSFFIFKYVGVFCLDVCWMYVCAPQTCLVPTEVRRRVTRTRVIDACQQSQWVYNWNQVLYKGRNTLNWSSLSSPACVILWVS